eukprot:m.213543 g.213543  ORF g.213543 m.213543 type:complete len:105 (+) comp18608_c1_seq3:4213-4527(+)
MCTLGQLVTQPGERVCLPCSYPWVSCLGMTSAQRARGQAVGLTSWPPKRNNTTEQEEKGKHLPLRRNHDHIATRIFCNPFFFFIKGVSVVRLGPDLPMLRCTPT